MFIIRRSVGAGGTNDPQDVGIVQDLLNLVAMKQGGMYVPLAVDGIAGPKTIQAIRDFQKKHRVTEDGRVDPDRQTLIKLNAAAAPLARLNDGFSFLTPKGLDSPRLV